MDYFRRAEGRRLDARCIVTAHRLAVQTWSNCFARSSNTQNIGAWSACVCEGDERAASLPLTEASLRR